MTGYRSSLRKRLAQTLKRSWHAWGELDARTEVAVGTSGADQISGANPGERWLLRLFPERRWRASPFAGTSAGRAGLVRILSLVPPEDSGGGSRPARLAAEFRRRGFEIEWRWALPIYPWPRKLRPQIPGVDARPWDESGRSPGCADLVLLEAPHPRLSEIALREPRRGPLVYDAIDVWDGELGADWYDASEELAAIEGADVLTASSHLLRDELAATSGRPVELLPNAIDLAAFREAVAAVPEPLRRGAPTIVYVGALWGKWVDLSLLEDLARRMPQAQMHMIGPAGTRSLPQAPNLHAHGLRPRSEIPALLASADVAVVPFAPGRLSEAVSPLKVFEYLAMGCPVVSTPLPDLEGVPGIRLARSGEDFFEAVVAASQEAFPKGAVEEFLVEHTWARRVDRLLEITAPMRVAGRGEAPTEEV